MIPFYLACSPARDRARTVIISAATDPSASILTVEGRIPATYTAGNQSYEVVTAADIKGLEREHVIVVDVEDLDTARGRAGSYVAMTRPRYSLYVLSSPDAYQIMERNALKYLQQQLGKGDAHNA